MTREEAIEKLELMRQKVDEETYRALILAIKALEQEPIKYWIDYNGHVTPIQQPCDTENCKIVKALTVTQKSGKWIAHSDGGIWIKYYECSKCGRGHNTHSDYCPNCGADMRGAE